MDGFLALLDADTDFKHFHMDGQFIPIEDYLEIRPHHRERIRLAAQSGRLSVGPWYVLQDEYLTSGEAQVRNLLIGMRLSREFAEPAMLGYLPDSFGNIGQMPQILRGFGIDNAVFGRGINRRNTDAPPDAPEEERGYASELCWASPDGSHVLGIFFANWYANAMVIPTDERCVPTVERIRDACLRYATTSHLLLMNGCDHTPSQPDISKAIARANAELTEDRLIHSSFAAYLDAVRSEAHDLQRVQGELRSRYTDGWGTLTNVLSSRLYQKRANWRCQNALEKWAEPFGAFAWLCGRNDESDYLEYAWKTLLQNHPHDSICGCSVDPVHAEMDTRFAKAEAVAEDLAIDALDYLAGQVDTASFADETPSATHPPDSLSDVAYLVVFNSTNIARRETVETTADFADGTPVADIAVTDANGDPVESVLLDSQRTWCYFLPDVGFRVPYHAQRARLLLFADVPPCGYATFRVRALSEPRVARALDEAFRNDYLSVVVHDDGTFDLEDRNAHLTFAGLGVLEDSLDVGDEYNYRAPLNDDIVRLRSVSVRRVEWNALRRRLEVRGRLPVSNGTLDVATELTLAQGHDALFVKTTIQNGKKNHRLRALFPTGILSEYASADGQFEVVQRPIDTWHGWKNPSNCQPCQAFVDVSDREKGLTVANRALPEYEVLRDGTGTVAVTLLRATGRVGDWGVFPTDDSQCLGENVAEYALIPHSGSLEGSGAALAARLYNAPTRVVQTASHAGTRPARHRFVGLNPSRFVLSTIKKAEDRDGLIVRFYNPFGAAETAKLDFGFPVSEAYRVRLDETREERLEVVENGVRLDVPGFKIVTVEVAQRTS
jgi:alpha-mannosidase/mannosylglycerate hydrolase